MKPIYVIPAHSHALDVLEDLQTKPRGATLDVLYRDTRVSRTSTYRILKTLEKRGYVRHADGYFYNAPIAKKLSIGLLSRNDDSPYFKAFNGSIRGAAMATETELIECRCSDKDTIRSWVKDLWMRNVGLVIENGLEQSFAPLICDEIIRTGVPMVSVDFPQPHATYFGLDDYRAGIDAGKLLALYAERYWAGRIDRVIGLAPTETAGLVKRRISGAFEVIGNTCPRLQPGVFTLIDATGVRCSTRNILLSSLKGEFENNCILIVASTEEYVIAALDAIQTLEQKIRIGIIGLGSAGNEILKREGKPPSGFLGLIGTDVSCYGLKLMELAANLLIGNHVLPHNYIPHKLFHANLFTSPKLPVLSSA